jgi:hypothetical protein
MSSQVLNSNTKLQAKKIQLEQAISLCSELGDRVLWALDFSDFESISEALRPIFDVVESAQRDLEREQDYYQEQIDDYELKLAQFESENSVEVS